MSMACPLCRCSRVRRRSRLVEMCCHGSMRSRSASSCRASLSSWSHSGLPLVSTYMRVSLVVDLSDARTSRTRETICPISGKQRARYRACSSDSCASFEGGGMNLSGNPGNSLKAVKREVQLARCRQCSIKSPRRMCSASRPERGVGLEYGEQEDGVREESAGWMRCAFAASAAVMSGDQEKCVTIGDLEYEDHISRSLVASPNILFPANRQESKIRSPPNGERGIERGTNENAPKIENLQGMRLYLHTPICRPLELVEPCLEHGRGRCLM